MSVPSAANNAPITSKRELVENIAGGGKSKRDWRIGTEHEKFVFRLSDRRRVAYEGPDGIRALLNSLERFGWTPILDGPNPIGLKKDGASISLEPGGQLELSGAPLVSIHQTCEEVNQHLAEAKAVDAELGIGLLGLGFDPQWSRADVPWMPKGRYKIMRDYMPKRGKLGLDMMLRTCTVQVNLDFADEADMVKKFRTSLALQPVATALFANSPFTDGKPNGFLSYRSHIWTDTDPDRSGMIPFVFEPGMGYERYVDYMLDVPMYFVYRDGKYIDASGQSFRDFMAGRLPAYPGQVPTLSDWADHLTTAFPEVRLKTYLEMRGADGGPWRRLCALPALWVGLLYDSSALDAAWDLCKDWSIEEIAAQRRDVPKHGLKTKFRTGTLRDVALRVVAIARQGLAARAMADKCGMDETGFLNTLQDIADRGQTPAEEMLEAYATRWQGNIDKVYEEYAY